MRRLYGLARLIGAVAILMGCLSGWAGATPSTTYWTPSVSDVQAYGVWHLGIDNYFTLNKKVSSGQQGAFPTDAGITVGALPYKRLNLELGVDLLHPADHFLYFNAKLGTPEGSLFSGSPALNVGIFNVGTKKDVTNFNIVQFIAGKTLPPNMGRLHVGYYVGNSKLLRSSLGEKENAGYMVGYDKWMVKDRLMLAADYASGKNAIGGGGVGLYVFFTKDVSVLVGPVWFNDKGINGAWKWTTQLDVNFSF